jgi:hypothetical protein
MDDAVHPQTAQQPVFFYPVDQVKGRVILPKKFSRMWVKSDYSRCKTVCPCGFDCGANHLLMALVNTIEIANRGAHRTVGQRRIADGPVNNFHWGVCLSYHGAALYRLKGININA